MLKNALFGGVNAAVLTAMNDDLSIVPARYNGTEDSSEYEEMLPSSPP